jgi:hypothetical protein
MAGSAGSKYGIIDDDVPVKKYRVDAAGREHKEPNTDRLRDILSLIRTRAVKKKIVQNRTH